MKVNISRKDRIALIVSNFKLTKNPVIGVDEETLKGVYAAQIKKEEPYYIAKTEFHSLDEILDKDGIDKDEFKEHLERLNLVTDVAEQNKPPVRVNSKEKIERALLTPENYGDVKKDMDEIVRLRNKVMTKINVNKYVLQINWNKK